MKTKLYLVFILLALFVSAELSAQITGGRKRKDAFPKKENKVMNWGWHVAPGLTYTVPFFGKLNGVDSLRNDRDFVQTGRFGAYLEGGLYHIFYNPVINYIDYGVFVKGVGSRETLNGDLMLSDASTISNPQAQFYQWTAGVHFNANNVINLSQYVFIQNSLGINFDLRWYHNVKQDTEEHPNLNVQYDEFYLAQLHYKFGIGFKVNEKLLIIPSIETPILTALAWDGGNPSFNYFNTRHQPLILSVRFMFLRKYDRTKCKRPPKAPFETGTDDNDSFREGRDY